MDRETAMRLLNAALRDYDQMRTAKIQKRAQYYDRALNVGTDSPGMLALARGIKPGLRKGSVLAQFFSEGAAGDFSSVTDLDLASTGPGNLYGERHEGSTTAFSEAIAAQYPTLSEMKNITRPTPSPTPWNVPTYGSGFEQRYRESPGRPDSGASASIPEVLGMADLSELSLKAALLGLLRKSGGNPHIAQACKLAADHCEKMRLTAKLHHEHFAGLTKAHSDAIKNAHTLQHAKALAAMHAENMEHASGAYRETMLKLAAGHRDEMGRLLTKAAQYGEPASAAVSLPYPKKPLVPDSVGGLA